MIKEEHLDDLPPPPEFAQVQLRKTGSRELLNIEWLMVQVLIFVTNDILLNFQRFNLRQGTEYL